MINQIQNQIITEIQQTLMNESPSWETKEEYQDYVRYEEEVAQTIRSLDSILTSMIEDGSDKETLIQFAINFIS